MPTKKDMMNPIREMESSAFLAYREWPVFLIRREKQLQQEIIVRTVSASLTDLRGGPVPAESAVEEVVSMAPDAVSDVPGSFTFSEPAVLRAKPGLQDGDVTEIQLSDVVADNLFLFRRIKVIPSAQSGILEKVRSGGSIAPIDVFWIDGSWRIGDGYQRYNAAIEGAMTTIPAVVHVGDLQDLIAFSADGKRDHMNPRGVEDKMVGARALVEHGSPGDWTDVSIADHCKVPFDRVVALRN